MPFDMVITDDMALAQLDKIGPDVREALERALAPLAGEIAADAKNRAEAHIRFLGVKPGQYLASIYGGVSSKEQRVVGYVRSGDPVAHLLEYGAQTPPHVIEASVKQVLAFSGDAGKVFAQKVNHPGAVIPAYPAITPALESRSGDISAAIEDAVRDTVRREF